MVQDDRDAAPDEPAAKIELKVIEKIAPTVELALAAALSEIELRQEDVTYEVLEEGRRGVLGIGRRDARIRISFDPMRQTGIKAREFVELVLLQMDLPGAVTHTIQGNRLQLDIASPGFVELASRDRRLIKALQHLVDRMTNRVSEHRVAVKIMIEGLPQRGYQPRTAQPAGKAPLETAAPVNQDRRPDPARRRRRLRPGAPGPDRQSAPPRMDERQPVPASPPAPPPSAAREPQRPERRRADQPERRSDQPERRMEQRERPRQERHERPLRRKPAHAAPAGAEGSAPQSVRSAPRDTVERMAEQTISRAINTGSAASTPSLTDEEYDMAQTFIDSKKGISSVARRHGDQRRIIITPTTDAGVEIEPPRRQSRDRDYGRDRGRDRDRVRSGDRDRFTHQPQRPQQPPQRQEQRQEQMRPERSEQAPAVRREQAPSELAVPAAPASASPSGGGFRSRPQRRSFRPERKARMTGLTFLPKSETPEAPPPPVEQTPPPAPEEPVIWEDEGEVYEENMPSLREMLERVDQEEDPFEPFDASPRQAPPQDEPPLDGPDTEN